MSGRAWLGIAAVGAFVAAVAVSSATFEPSVPTSTTLPPVSSQPPPTRLGGSVTTSVTEPPPPGAGVPGPPGSPGAQGPPGPPGATVLVLPAPTTGLPPITTAPPVQATTTTRRCHSPPSTGHPTSTMRPCLPK